jgi:hypothetical protein
MLNERRAPMGLCERFDGGFVPDLTDKTQHSGVQDESPVEPVPK